MTIITIILSLTVFLMILLPLLNWNFILKNLSGRLLAVCCIAVMVRALVPVEFPFSKTILVPRVLPAIRDFMKEPIILGTFSVKLYELLLFIWIAAAFVLIARKFMLYFQLRKVIRDLPECGDAIVQETMQALYKKYPSAKLVRVVKTNLTVSPLITGFRDPVILLPGYSFEQTEYRMVLEHELLHCIRHDTIIKFAADILCSVYWWNIPFYILKSKIFELLEMGNDRQMTRAFSDGEKAAYMQCLVSTLKKIGKKSVPFTLSFNSSKKRALRRRIHLISHYQTARPLTKYFTLIGTFLLLWLITSFTLEPYAMPEGENYIRMDEYNSYFIQDGDLYELYYENAFLYTIDSLEYYDPNIPVYQKGERINE